MRTRELFGLAVVVALSACGSDDSTVSSAPSIASSTTTVAEDASDAIVAIDFNELPDGYARTEGSGAVMFAIGGGQDPGKPTAHRGARRTTTPEFTVDVSVYAGRADLFDGFADDAEPSTLRGGTAVINRLEHMTMVLWSESDALVWLSASADIPAGDLDAIVESVRIEVG